jgi:hypothetical protein
MSRDTAAAAVARAGRQSVRAELEEAFAARPSRARPAGSAAARARSASTALSSPRSSCRGRVDGAAARISTAGPHGIAEVRAGYAALSIGRRPRVHRGHGARTRRLHHRVERVRDGRRADVDGHAGDPHPFPHAAAHQLANAVARERGAPNVIPDGPDTAERLATELGRLLASSERLDSMAAAAARLGRPGAARRVLEVIDEVVAKRRREGRTK